MKTLFRSLFLGGLISAALSLPGLAAAFEGKITFTVSSGKSSQALNYAIKGDAVRMEIDAEGRTMASIVDLQKREMLMLMPQEKMYMVMPFKDAVEPAMNEAELKQHNIEKTGRTDTILGYKCDEYVSRDRNATTEIWVAEGLGTFLGLSAGEGGPMGGRRRAAAQSWEKAFKGKPGFPLRVVTRDAKSRETYKMEATKIEPGKLPASLFQPPADFQRFQMPSLGDLNPFKQKG